VNERASNNQYISIEVIVILEAKEFGFYAPELVAVEGWRFYMAAKYFLCLHCHNLT
jgi:hypothetical protein